MGPLFFVSYASSTGDRGPVQRMYSDIQKEIHSLLGRGRDTSGRLKQAAPTPEPDPAVLDARCMVALYSAEYVRDDQCGKEWSVFLERMNRQTRRTGQQPASLVGVLWRPEGLVLPRIVADTGQILDDVGQGYRGLGALGLMRDPGGWEGYRLIVRRIAQRIATAATVPLPEMTDDDSRTVAPRFGSDHLRRPGGPPQPTRSGSYRLQPPRPQQPPEAAPEPDPSALPPLPRLPDPPQEPPGSAQVLAGPSPNARRHVIVVLATGGRSRMEELRRSVSVYGETAQDWKPFRPQDEEPAVSIVRRALRACDIDRMTVIPLSASRTAPLPLHAAPPREPGTATDPGSAQEPWPAPQSEAGRTPGTLPGPQTGRSPRTASPPPAAEPVVGTSGPAAPTSVVVLVDPWMAGDADFPTLWTQLRQHASSVAAVIVVLSRGDEETRVNAARLRRSFAHTPELELDAPHHEAGSPESLAHTVLGALADVESATTYTPAVRAVDPARESSVERISRRQRERSAWVTREPGPLPSLSGLLPGELWGGG